MTNRTSSRLACCLILGLIVAMSVPPAAALVDKEARDQLDLLVFSLPELRVVETPIDAEAIRDELPNMEAIDAFRAEHGARWRVMLDAGRGVPTLVGGGAIPWIPGPANDLVWESAAPGCRAAHCIPAAEVEAIARDFLKRHDKIFAVQQVDLRLDPDGTTGIGASIYLLRFQWHLAGIPIEGGSVLFRINNGNLVQVVTENVGPIAIDPVASISPRRARRILEEYLGPFNSDQDRFLDKGSLHIVPVTPPGQDPGAFDGPVGAGIAYRLAYRIAFDRPGVVGTWEALIDAHDGEILRFVDTNRYGRIHGGAYPRDNHEGEADRPLPFADTGLPPPNEFADAGGLFPGDNATTTFIGKYTWINDACGAISNTTTEGDVDFSMGPGLDCDVPDPNSGGAGNTHSSRTQYYHLTNVNIKARTYMPSNDWLNNNHMNANVNGSPWCNATSGGGTLNFYQADTGCWNLGEIPGVSLHEWGHSMDDFDGSGGDSRPVETRADWTAVLQTHDSCLGRGFFLDGNCDGYGDACLDCNGVRDGDWRMHENNTPWTAANHGTFFNCSGGSYYGPCGWGDHCESGISTQALWDFVNFDLVGPPTNMDLTTAWMLEDRLFYASMPTLGNMYTCSAPNSDGCNGGSLYNSMMALDDDGDGTANGTPHAAAIFAALDRHNIACGAVDDPQNQNQTSCPELLVTTLTADPGSDAANLSWDPVANATRYLIFRNEISCDAGFVKVGEVLAPTTTFTDTTVVNGIEYYYRFQGATDSDSCTTPMSACATVTPQPCAGSVRLDRTTYNCDDAISIVMVDSDLTGNGFQDVTVWSDSEPTPETLQLTESPGASGIFTGTIATSTSTGSGDGAVGVTDGDTITVRYGDLSYCGPPQDVDATAAADCVGPSISGVQALNVTGFSADILWDTNEASNSLVVYENADPPTANSATDAAWVTSHSVHLTGLEECTRYYFYVASADPAGNSVTEDNGGSYFTFTTGKNVNPTYPSADTPVDIPDDDPAGAASIISVADDKPVIDVDVTVNITHTYDGDLEISLIGPNSTEILLVDNRGSSGENFVDTVFDDEATTAIADGSPPFTGSFRPEVPLSAFDGLIAQGDWTLKVVDTAGYDTGSIDSWGLTLLFPAESCPTSAGWVEIEETVYGCSATIQVTAQDVDLLGTGNLVVELFSDSETTPEDVSLAEAPANSGVFLGSFLTTGDPAVPGDGLLSLATGDTITARYIDADDGQGGTNVEQTDTATADCDGPSIHAVQVANITGRSADIEWWTSEAADSTVIYDLVVPPTTSSVFDASMVNTHLMALTGLTECTRYYFYVMSSDEHQNTAQHDNSGAFFTFSTLENNEPDYVATDTPVVIDDYTTVNSVINVPDDKAVEDVNVLVNITHTYDGDLEIALVGPDSTRVMLCDNRGSSGENFVDTVFDDEAATAISDGSPPYTGSFRPEQPLSAFDALLAQGDWTLEVSDTAGGDQGSIDAMNLELPEHAIISATAFCLVVFTLIILKDVISNIKKLKRQ